MSNFDGRGIVGTRLGQVFAVRIKDIYGDLKNCEVYGNIVVQDVDGPLSIYNKDKTEKQGIHPGATLSVAQPNRPIYASKPFNIYLDLKYADDKEFIRKSHLVTHSSTNKASLDERIKELCDRNQSVEIEGEMGVATVYYSVLKVAVPVLIEASFEKCSGRDNVRVYGSLVARYGKRFNHGDDDVAKEHSRVVLFSKKPDEAIVVNKDSNDLHLLLKSFVPVPVYSSLTLEADFKILYLDDDEEVDEVRESKEFPVEKVQIKYESFKGQYDEIMYRVFFLPSKCPGAGIIIK